MHTLTNASMPLKLFGAVLALALIAATALTLALTAGGAQAQSPDNTYDDPQPCGPGAQTAFQPEPHEVTTGHFALFDAYWQWTSSEDLDNTGVLRTNACPPLVTRATETDRGGRKTTTTSYSASGIDIDEAIIHVLDEHKATVVTSASDNPSGTEISLAEYPGLNRKSYAIAGDQVWWLRLDNPTTTNVDETSDLTLGFSTHRLDDRYWGDAEDNGPPLRYKYELQRYPGIDPVEHPHFLAYRAPGVWAGGDEENGVELVWDSARADTEDMMLEPGQTEDLQWVFTKPGTYVLSVHLQGWVRQARPDGAGRDWLPISSNTTESSEVKRYVIQVGDKLAEVEPPSFGVTYSVTENSPAGTQVGEPVEVHGAEVDTLEYSLSGKGHEHFRPLAGTDPDTVKIVVADHARLDRETQPAYDLTLGVTDNVDHESNPDSTIDHTLAVRIDLEDVPTFLEIEADNSDPVVGDIVTFTAVIQDFGGPGQLDYFWSDSSGEVSAQLDDPHLHEVRHTEPITETVSLSVRYLPEDGTAPDDYQTLSAEPVSVTWRNP